MAGDLLCELFKVAVPEPAGMPTLSLDLRERILKAYDRGNGTRAQITARYDVSLGMVKKLLQQLRYAGDIAPRHRFSGAKPKITEVHQHQLARMVSEYPDMTLQELRDTLGVPCTPQAVFYVLERMGLSPEKDVPHAELSRPDIQLARARWGEVSALISHARFLFIDKSGAKTNISRLYGRARGGIRVNDSVPNGRWQTTTMIAAVGRNGPQAPWVLEGPMGGKAFLVWAQAVLAPTLKATDIVVMDNISVHKNRQARAAIEATGATIWDLPAYSPDLNPIEKMWSKIKAYLREVKARALRSHWRSQGSSIQPRPPQLVRLMRL